MFTYLLTMTVFWSRVHRQRHEQKETSEIQKYKRDNTTSVPLVKCERESARRRTHGFIIRLCYNYGTDNLRPQ